MGTDKRARQKAHRAERLQAEWEAQQKDRRRRTLMRALIIGAIIVLAVVGWNLLTGGDDETVTDATASTDLVATTTAPTTEPVTTEPAEQVCPAEDGSSERQIEFAAPQLPCIDANEKYVAEFVTTVGDFEVLIDPALDEVTANNFVNLARFHAYDGTTFHRIISDFVVQGGDVAGLNGVGNPGYLFTGGSPEAGQYRVGSIAMANSAGPSTNGSQFFIITGPAGVGLPPNFSLFGQVISGIDVPLEMQNVDTDEGDRPIVDVVATTVTIRVATADDIAAYEEALAG